jgi:hypothetical protein
LSPAASAQHGYHHEAGFVKLNTPSHDRSGMEFVISIGRHESKISNLLGVQKIVTIAVLYFLPLLLVALSLSFALARSWRAVCVPYIAAVAAAQAKERARETAQKTHYFQS